jgi:ribonuclease G
VAKKNTLVINCDIGETRVALIENGILAELHVERRAQKGIVGNIYLGKVSRVLPGMSAAFIDIGEERAAFLHVEDLIRPADFEEYLAGGRRREEARHAKREALDEAPGDSDEVDDGEGNPSDPPEPSPVIAAALEAGSDIVPEVRATLDVLEPKIVIEPDAPVLREARDDDEIITKVAPRDPEMATRRRRRGGRGGAKRREIATDVNADAPAAEDGGSSGDAAAAAAGDDDDDFNFGYTVTELNPDGTPPTPPPPPEERAAAAEEPRRERGRRGRDRRGGKGGDRNRGTEQRSDRSDRGGERKDKAARDGGLRLARSTPINEVVKEGQEVIVQVTKDPIGTKGARVSSHVSLPGRYVVYMPTVEHVGVSRRIGNDIERRRLREAIDAMKPPQGGLIVRTVAEGLTKKHLKADVGYLVRLWGEIAKKKEERAKAPTMLYQELDVVLRTARDMFTDDVEKIVIDDKEQYQRLLRFIEMFMPERAKDIELYPGDEPIFDAYGLEDEIARALSRKVPLSSGGYLIIDQAEALTAIDVNSGRFVGKGNKDPEDTILQTNLEAVAEIAYQLRFRNIGGLIVLDLIDMEKGGNREKVYRALEQALLSDKAKTSINRISELGLVEMTRKRTRESLGRMLHEGCFYCDGTGQLQSRTTIAYEILRQIRRERRSLPGYKVIVNAHPSVVDLLQTEERDTLKESERRYQRQIMLVPHKEYHLEQFDLQGS